MNNYLKKLFGNNKTTSASLAKERLQIILAHEKNGNKRPAYLQDLQKELLEVISKYVKIDQNDLRINVENQGNLEVLEVKIELQS